MLIGGQSSQKQLQNWADDQDSDSDDQSEMLLFDFSTGRLRITRNRINKVVVPVMYPCVKASADDQTSVITADIYSQTVC